MKGVFLDFDTVCHEGDLHTTELDAVLDAFVTWPVSAPEEIPGRLTDAEVLLTNKVKVSAAVMDSAPKLKLICLAATGFDNVDVEAAKERGIAVCNITAYCTRSVAQHVFTLILALNQHLDAYRQRMREGDWERSPHFTMLDYPIHELAGRSLGIIGYGELGRGVVRLAEAFGMEVLVAERPGHEGPLREGRLPLAAVLEQSDILSLHCPLTEHTRNLIDADALRRMPAHALLINTARGAVVDEQALADALRQGEIAGAGVDVLSQEPPVDGNPLLADDIPNLILTPHIAWGAVEARQRALDEMAMNVRAFLEGEKRNRVV
ncbi:D-2-hydroxyacid dehydrogenase [Natronospira bacteriovora]|uniref:D-2-hydroxyacid dehydrogenase n=1 Tax=Natronospira bacteriovora TaxID=3069753 RepID=A0ABU0W861_9GAMM|nr:D-2-hydroxyacid dehydrogenase [Natronospira sp. AB-CW4]MDQ2070226.1 D-2-hydroxyacid dehydrogenase [Natronospira sp. AB-CW4]